MIVYQESKTGFMNHVRENRIDYIISKNFEEKLGKRTAPSEVNSWRNSLQYMRNVLDDQDIPESAMVTIECQIPNTSKRIDFIISGQNEERKDCAVVIELKQWEQAHRTTMDGIVRTVVGGGMREVSHPSYQAWSYVALLEGFNQEVYEGGIHLQPCAFLHNCEFPGDLVSEFYRQHLEKAPLFIRQDVNKLAEFIRRFVKHGDCNNVMYRIEQGRIRPSKTLADAVAGMIHGNEEFVMIDEQKVVFEQAMALITTNDRKKHVLIVHGGPGTGKSVVAVQLTAQLTARRMMVQFVSKNSAPRQVFASRLSGYRSKSWINNLFKGSGSYVDAGTDTFDALVVDEAHRLNEKSGLYGNLGENQIGEIIRAARCSVFFIDEDQRVTIKDIGTSKEIENWAKLEGAEIHHSALESQFRCSGSDGYLAWLDQFLGIRETANTDLTETGYKLAVCNSPLELRERITELNTVRNRARMVAGYCWPWNSKSNPSAMDIVIPEENFAMQWNLTQDGSLWIIAPESINQIGCIHTCQGLEVDWIGVLLGPDFVIREGEWICNASARARSDKSVFGLKQLLRTNPEEGRRIESLIIRNTYRTLMTRGMQGCLVWSSDTETQMWLRQQLPHNNHRN